MSNKVIKVGIAGFGRSGYGIHANWLKNDNEKFKIIAVADEIEERRKDAIDQFGCKVYSNHKELIKAGGFDLLVNATPSRFHVETTMSSLKKGYHVLSEKPSATTVKEFDLIVATAQKAGKVFYPFQNSRFYPFFQKMCKIINSGVLGEIVYVRSNWSGFGRRWDWQTMQDQIGGNLWNTGPHPVDQLIVLFGEGTPEVHCKMYANHYPFNGDANNFCLLTFTGKNKPVFELCLNSFQAFPQGDMYNISGTCGGLTGGPSGLKWKYFNPKDAPKQQMWEPWSLNRQYCSETLPWVNETWEYSDTNSNATGFSEMVRSLYSNLYDVLSKGAEPEIKLSQVRQQIYVMEEAHRQNPLPKRR